MVIYDLTVLLFFSFSGQPQFCGSWSAVGIYIHFPRLSTPPPPTTTTTISQGNKREKGGEV